MRTPQIVDKVREWTRRLPDREDRISILLSFVIGALVGLVVVFFILLLFQTLKEARTLGAQKRSPAIR